MSNIRVRSRLWTYWGGAVIALLLAVAGIVAGHASSAYAAGDVYYEAENGVLTGGASVAADPNASLGYKVGFLNNVGDSVQWNNVSVANAGTYSLTIHYSNGYPDTRYKSLYVNGSKVVQVGFPATGNWNIYGTVTVSASLQEGSNTIKLQFDSADSAGTDIDYLFVPGATSAWSVMNDSDPIVGYTSTTGSIVHDGGAAGYYQSDNHFSITAGDYTEYRFRGTGVRWIGSKNNNHGKADVYVDGVNQGIVDSYGPVWEKQRILYEKTGLSDGIHTIKIVVRSDKNASSSGYATDWDAFETISAGTKYEAEAGTVGGGASTVSDSYASAGSKVGYLDSTGAYVQFNSVNVARAGYYDVKVRYSNGYPDARQKSVYVNGTKVINGASFASTGSFNVYSDLTFAVHLNVGSNTIKIQKDSTDLGGTDIDRINVSLRPRSAKVVSTTYPTEDVVISDFDVTDYGADVTGTSDSTVAIQQALDDCYSTGGGTVWMPVGKYKVSSTLKVYSFCSLRGDWRDPDSGTGSYGTVIWAYVPSGTGELIRLDGTNAGVVGLTFYYPNQSAASPIDFGYVIRGDYDAAAVYNVTFLNAYKGILVGRIHGFDTFENIKGTALAVGLELRGTAAVDSTQKITFNNSYWANAGAIYNAPLKSTLDAYTRANSTAFLFSDNDAAQHYKLKASDYKYGIRDVNGPRDGSWGSGFSLLDIQNTDYAALFESGFRKNGILRSTLKGSVNSINFTRINTIAELFATDNALTGSTTGAGLTVLSPGTSPTAYTEGSPSKTTSTTLYDVTKTPYYAPYVKASRGNLPTVDATSAIQSALNAAGTAGGGIVYLPPGWYKVSTHLTVPANVELRGASSTAIEARATGEGTVLFAYEGENTTTPTTDTAFITLNGNKSGLRGLRVFYPNNPMNSAANIKKFPYTVRVNNADDVYIVNVEIENGSHGVDIANGSDRHFIKRLFGFCADNFVRVGTSTEGWIEQMHDLNPTSMDGELERYGIAGFFNDWAGTDNFAAIRESYMWQYTNWITINGASNEHLLNIGGCGVKSGVYVSSGTADIWNLVTDQLYTNGYSVTADAGSSVKVMNSMAVFGQNTSGTGIVGSYNPMRHLDGQP
jgi:hypothetical protein